MGITSKQNPNPKKLRLILLTPTFVREQIHNVARTPQATSWASDAKLVVVWLSLWILLLLGAILSPIIAMLLLIFQERRWRVAMLFFAIVPIVVVVLLVVTLLFSGMAGFQFGK
jgi:hypothetical protein